MLLLPLLRGTACSHLFGQGCFIFPLKLFLVEIIVSKKKKTKNIENKILHAFLQFHTLSIKLTNFNPQIYLGIPEMPTDAYTARLKQQGKRLTSEKLIVEQF